MSRSLTRYKRAVLREGPVPALVHGLYEYAGGVALIALPLVLDYKHGAAIAASIVLGVLLIVVASTSRGSTSLVNQLPLPVHVLLDYALAAILIASPFVFGFSSETVPTAVFLVGGVLHLLISIGTRFKPRDADEGPRRRRRSAEPAAPLPTEGGKRGGAAEPGVVRDPGAPPARDG